MSGRYDSKLKIDNPMIRILLFSLLLGACSSGRRCPAYSDSDSGPVRTTEWTSAGVEAAHRCAA